MFTLRSLISTCMVIQCIWLNRFTYGLDCYQCTHIQNISDCHNLVQCNADEFCFTDTTGLGMNTHFTLGCRPKQSCLSAQSLTTTTVSSISIIGRSLASNLDCSQCCAVDACNKQMCTTGTKPLGNSQCEDDPTFNCPSVSSVFNICNDRHHAKLKCKKFCGLCNITDGNWSTWQSWSGCSVTCGPGTKNRMRICDHPAPRDGGLPCVGESSQQLTCNTRACPVHGGWSRWSQWGTCSVSCGIGLQRRDRTCSNPYPGPDGEPCWGDARDDKACFIRACADGNWSNWSTWTSCSATCLGGIKTRTRTCTNPAPSKFGHDCIGNSEETDACSTTHCTERNGGWGVWSSWSTCSLNFMKRRTRLCNNPSPSQYGHNCAGTNEQIEICSMLLLGTPPMRLVNGTSELSGRLEVFHQKWGNVCDDSFDDDDAKVICRMLGFETSRPYAKTVAYFGQGSLPIILDDLSCTGNELTIDSCSHSTWMSENCGHNEDAGVVCAPLIRLRGGPNSHSGRVEVKYGGVWGTVCDDYFTTHAAQVVCRSLGFTTSGATFNNSYHGSGEIHLDNVNCKGTEKSLEECKHKAWNKHDCSHTEDVSVFCR